MGRRCTDDDPAPPDDAALREAIRSERHAAVCSLCDLVAPLCVGTHWALYGFSSGAMLAYLMTLEMERRAAGATPTHTPTPTPTPSPPPPPRPPFRLFVCGRGAPHCVHTSRRFWRAARCGTDDAFMTLMNDVIAVPLPAAAELPLKAGLWRAAIVPAMVHCGDEPKLPPSEEEGEGAMPPFPLPPSTPDVAGAYRHAASVPKVHATPLIAIGSSGDRVWPWGLPALWEGVAGAGFRCEQIEAVAHFKLMVDAKVVDIVQRELAAAALVEARWG